MPYDRGSDAIGWPGKKTAAAAFTPQEPQDLAQASVAQIFDGNARRWHLYASTRAVACQGEHPTNWIGYAVFGPAPSPE